MTKDVWVVCSVAEGAAQQASVAEGSRMPAFLVTCTVVGPVSYLRGIALIHVF
jgi:hypothetical protein